MHTCPGCGALYQSPNDSCAVRFDALLALDHSQREPWGSRHGVAFSAFALQHSDRFTRDVLERAWLLLFNVYVKKRDAKRVADALRRFGKHRPDWDAPPLPAAMPTVPFEITIGDLGSFGADSYAETLDRWCQAALAGWCADIDLHC